jgi:hypothetical protein
VNGPEPVVPPPGADPVGPPKPPKTDPDPEDPEPAPAEPEPPEPEPPELVPPTPVSARTVEPAEPSVSVVPEDEVGVLVPVGVEVVEGGFVSVWVSVDVVFVSVCVGEEVVLLSVCVGEEVVLVSVLVTVFVGDVTVLVDGVDVLPADGSAPVAVESVEPVSPDVVLVSVVVVDETGSVVRLGSVETLNPDALPAAAKAARATAPSTAAAIRERRP